MAPVTLGELRSIDLRVPAVRASLPRVRSAVRGFTRADDAVLGAEPDVAAAAADVELAMSELATNVVEHAPAHEIIARLTELGRGWELRVAPAEVGAVERIRGAGLPAPTSPHGRGLAIVRAVMDAVEPDVLDGRPAVRCRRRI